jgi:hypothetical protein
VTRADLLQFLQRYRHSDFNAPLTIAEFTENDLNE